MTHLNVAISKESKCISLIFEEPVPWHLMDVKAAKKLIAELNIAIEDLEALGGEPSFSIKVEKGKSTEAEGYVGLPSMLGNVYAMQKHQYGEEKSLKVYESWLTMQSRKTDSPNYKEFQRLLRIANSTGLVLRCPCDAGERCHAHLIEKVLRKMNDNAGV